MTDLHQGDVEGPAAEIVNQHGTVRGGVGDSRPAEGVGQGRGRWFIEDIEDVQSGNAPGVDGRLPARVVVVRRDCDDAVTDGTELNRRILRELPQHDGGQRFRAVVAAGHESPVIRASHAPFDERGDAVGLLESQVEGRLTDHGRPIGREIDRRGREDFAVPIRDHDRPAAIVERGDRGECRAQVYANQGHVQWVV